VLADVLQRRRALEEGRNSVAKDTAVVEAPISTLCSVKRISEALTPISKRYKDFAHNPRP
jgi:hypothetical protein